MLVVGNATYAWTLQYLPSGAGSLVFALFPADDEPNKPFAVAKILLLTVLLIAGGAGVYLAGRRRQQKAAAAAAA